jgi:hypothetical protein
VSTRRGYPTRGRHCVAYMVVLLDDGFFLANLVTLWATVSLCRILRALRITERGVRVPTFNSLLGIENRVRNLQAYKSVETVLATGCFANQILRVWQIYALRITDANPLFALKDAWNVSQVLIGLLLILEIIRWYGFATLETFSSYLKRGRGASCRFAGSLTSPAPRSCHCSFRLNASQLLWHICRIAL